MMIQNHIILAIRSLWRNRLFTTLNVLGLSIGLSAGWVVWQYTHFERSFDTQIPNGGQVYRVVSDFVFDGERNSNSGCPEPLYRAAEIIAGVEQSIPVQDYYAREIIPDGTTKPFEEQRNIVKTTGAYFGLVPYQWLAGSAATALKQPNQVVLSRTRGEKYFPRHRPDEMMGKTITYHFSRDTTVAEVVGVVEDLNFPTSFIGKEFLTAVAPKVDQWGSVNSGTQLWLVLTPNADPTVVAKAINDVSSKNSVESMKQWQMERWHTLQKLSDVHFAEHYGSHIRSANPKVLAILGAIAAFLLLLACINYINLASAQIPSRSREIGVRKTLGGRNTSLIAGFLTETVMVCLLAVGLSVLLSGWAFNAFKEELPEDILLYVDWRSTLLFLSVLVTGVSLITGLYPGWLMSRFQPVSLLRRQFAGQAQNHTSRGNLRKGLIVFQFFIAQVFIIGALVVGQQLHFMRSSDVGFDREALLILDVPYKLLEKPLFKDKQFVLADALGKLSEVKQVAMGDQLLSNNYSSNILERTDENGQKHQSDLYRKIADTSLIGLYGLPILAGRNLAPSDTTREYVINETAVKAFGFLSPESAIGQYLEEEQGEGLPKKRWPIVGVVSDFHTMGFEEKIKPTAMMTNKQDLSTLHIKLASRQPSDWPEAMKKMEATWAAIYPGVPFEPKFYDETIADIYESDITMSRFINLATGIAMFISCLGLFGLATFTAFRRTKEIGIRKVLGASANSIVQLLSKEFLGLVCVAFILAVPLAIYFLRRWLEGFAYRIELEWWVFVAAGVGALLIAFLTVSFQSLKAALANPVKSLRSE